MLKKVKKATIEELCEEPFASVICYPRSSKIELKRRLTEMRKLGVGAVEFSGEKEAFNVSVLGKGCVGVVVIAYVRRGKAAMKIRRVDADRSMMQREAEMLKMANSVGVGPRLLGVSKNLLLMQFIDGDVLPKWLEKRISKTQVKAVLRSILEQCRKLDEIGLDHGELSHAPKHVIIDKAGKPFIVDFETASVSRRPSNVTSICQFLFISGVVAEKVARKLGKRDREAVVKALRLYKNDRTRENFEKVLRVCGL